MGDSLEGTKGQQVTRNSDFRATKKIQKAIMKLNWAIKKWTKYGIGKLEMKQRGNNHPTQA